jgi:hypothetical protein
MKNGIIVVNMASVVAIIVLLIEINALSTKLKSLNNTYIEAIESSITFDIIRANKEERILSYIESNYKGISCVVAKLTAESIVECSEGFQIPIDIVVGIIEVESSFDPSQVSSANARGLMQVRWSVWGETLTKETNMESKLDLHKIDNGIVAGLIVLKYYIVKNNGDLSKALYDYVGKSENYVTKVYKSIGRFMLHEQRGK